MRKITSFFWKFAIFLASAGGIAAFYFLFISDFNIYWLILSPIIFALYQGPAVYLLWLWKKRKNNQ